MILDLEIFIGIIGFMMLYLGYEKDSILFTMISLLSFIVLFASTLQIEFPYAVFNTTSTQISTGTFYSTDTGVQAFFLGMIFIDIIMLIVQLSDYQKNKKVGL